MSNKSRLIADGTYFQAGFKNAVYNNIDKNQTINLKPIFQRWVVVDVIFDPVIVNQKKIDYYQEKYSDTPIVNLSYMINRELPRNSIIARKIVNSSEGSNYGYDSLMILYPFFPSHLSLPCKPGEHIWVLFEHLTRFNDVGYWICGIVGQGTIDDVNHTHHPRDEDSSFNPTKDALESHEQINTIPTYHYKSGMYFPDEQDFYERILTESEASLTSVYESVPRFKKRPSDVVLEGSNNTLIVLGRDRTGSAVEYKTIEIENSENIVSGSLKVVSDDQNQFFKKRNAGSIDIVAGRGQTEKTSGTTAINSLLNQELDKTTNPKPENEGDPDFKNDRSRIYISQNTLVDNSLGLSSYNSNLEINDNTTSGDAGIIVKSDKIRIFARSDVQILVSGFDSSTTTTTISQELPEGLEFLKSETEKKFESTVKNQKDSNINWASITIKSNGDIIFKPSEKGYIKLGDETADKAILCTDFPAVTVNTPFLLTTGADSIGTGAAGQGTFSKKVLVK